MDQECDVAGQLLKALASRGPLTLPDLLEATGARLSDVLHALQDIRQFHLVEFIEESGVVQLTATGNRTATVVAKQSIHEQAAGLLEG